jgi:hypothetical protein
MTPWPPTNEERALPNRPASRRGGELSAIPDSPFHGDLVGKTTPIGHAPIPDELEVAIQLLSNLGLEKSG